LFAASPHEERGVVDESGHDLDAPFAQIAGKIRRREQGHGAADTAQLRKRPDRQKTGIAGTEPRDAYQHGAPVLPSTARLRRPAQDKPKRGGPGFRGGLSIGALPRYFVGAADGAAVAADVVAGDAAPGGGVGNRSAKRGSFTWIVAFCCKPWRNG